MGDSPVTQASGWQVMDERTGEERFLMMTFKYLDAIMFNFRISLGFKIT